MKNLKKIHWNRVFLLMSTMTVATTLLVLITNGFTYHNFIISLKVGGFIDGIILLIAISGMENSSTPTIHEASQSTSRKEFQKWDIVIHDKTPKQVVDYVGSSVAVQDIHTREETTIIALIERMANKDEVKWFCENTEHINFIPPQTQVVH